MSQHHHDLVVLGGSPDIKVPAAHEGPRRRVPDDEDWACCPTWILLETDGASSEQSLFRTGRHGNGWHREVLLEAKQRILSTIIFSSERLLAV